MTKEIEVQFDEKAYSEYLRLKEDVLDNRKSRKRPTYQQLLSSIDNTIKNLKADPNHGNLIPRRYLSNKIIQKYGTDKIFRVELVGYWRLLYTLIGDEAKIIAFILEFMDHKRYDKIFGYRKR